MRNALLIAWNDLRVFFADRENLFGLILMPVVLTVILGGAFGGNANATVRLRVDLLDLDNTPQSQQFIQAIKAANQTIWFCPLEDGQATFTCDFTANAEYTLELGQQRVSERETNALIVIPAGYGAALQAFTPLSIDYYSLADATTGDIVLTAVQTAAQQVNSAIVAARVGVAVGVAFGTAELPTFADAAARETFTQQVYTQAQTLLAAQPLTVTYTIAQIAPEDRPIAQTQGFGQSVPGIGSMFVMFTVFGGLFLLIRERKQWTLQRLVILPISRAEILGGKMIAYFTLGMIQYVIVFSVGFATGTDFGNDPLAIFLMMVSFVACITALTMALATFLTTEGQANGLSFLLSMTFAPLGGAWWPAEIMPPFMQAIGRLSPVSWAMEGFREVIFFGGGLPDVLFPAAVLWGMAAVFFVIGVRGFRYE
jgi:ABC-2 type transport system permease protein